MKTTHCTHDVKRITGMMFIANPRSDCVSVSGFKLRKYLQVLETAKTNGLSKERAKQIIELFY